MRSPCLWDYTVCHYGKITKKECAIDVLYYDINSNENEICICNLSHTKTMYVIDTMQNVLF